jgi:hypothetical protein
VRLLLVSALALVFASSAAAAWSPFPPRNHLPIVQFEQVKTKEPQQSCTAHADAKVGGQKRRLLPVACEQPPRSKVRDAGFVIVLAP